MSEHKKLGPVHATMLVASTMMGSGIFMLPASLGAIGSISMLAWISAMLGAGLFAGVFSFLAVMNPGTPSLFSYIRAAFGPGAGFVAGVLYWAGCMIAGAAIALAVTGYLSVFVPWFAKSPGATLATIAVVWLAIGANALGPRFVARLQGWSLGLGLVPVLLAAIGGWFYFHGTIFTASWNITGESAFAVVPRATVMVFWAFMGLETAIVLGARVRNPERDVPIGTLGGLAIAAAVYMAACAAIMGILPAAALAKSSAPFADAAMPIVGAAAAGLVALCAVLKASGTLTSNTLLTLETAESEAVLASTPRPRASAANLLFTGAFTSLIIVASASPTLARQFTIVTNVAVVLCMMVYGGASLSLLRLSTSLSRHRILARVLALAGSAFAAALIGASEPGLLVWSACAVLIALAGYQPVRLKRARAAVGT